jgi:hypothetical protein
MLLLMKMGMHSPPPAFEIITDNFSSNANAVSSRLSHNCQNQSQKNAVFPEQEEMDRVGVEPTTSAMLSSTALIIAATKWHVHVTLIGNISYLFKSIR